MTISASSIDLASRHLRIEHHRVEERFRFWVGQRPAEDGRPASPRSPGLADRTVSRPPVAEPSPRSSGEARVEDRDSLTEVDPEVDLLRRLIEAMTGRRVRVVRAEDLQGKEPVQDPLADLPRASSSTAPDGSSQPAGWGLEYDYRETRYEAEATDFVAHGFIRTTDGREIRFTTELQLRREFLEETTVSVRAGDAVVKDPLVLNFAGTAAQLSPLRFEFDLDADGTAELMPGLAPGSGYLVLDRNGNGQVDDGTELFGPRTGEAFAELAVHDSDGNGWIDEADPVFGELQVWFREPDGQDRLQGLGEAGVGALYLGNVGTPFTLATPLGKELGQLRTTGVYLGENGDVGTLQQLDVRV